MAPMTRSHASAPQASPSDGWAAPESRIEKERSEGLDWSFGNEFEMKSRNHDGDSETEIDYYAKKMPLTGPDDEDDVLHPLRQAANRIGSEIESFAQILDSCNPQRINDQNERKKKIFELINKFHKVSLNTVDHLRDKHASERRKNEGRRWRKKMRGFKITQDDLDDENPDDGASSDPDISTTIEDLNYWEQEAHTWDLLRRLVVVRFDSEARSHRPVHKYFSRQQLHDHFLATEELALERVTVLKWLKDIAEESGDEIDLLVEDLQQNAEQADIIAYGWLHTKAALKDHKRRIGSTGALSPKDPNVEKILLNNDRTEPLSTHLDPDAPNRQGRKLATQDQYFERAIWLGCYELLRRGASSKKIVEWCKERMETWRAVSILGISFEASEPSNEFLDPASMIRWREMCLKLAHNCVGTDYEKAVYGILGGDTLCVEPVCKSWDDYVFIHYNTMLKSQFDIYLKNINIQLNSPEPHTSQKDSKLGSSDGESRVDVLRLISGFMSDPRIAKESAKPMKVLQGVLIADQFAHFIFQQGISLSQIANAKEVSRVIPSSKHQLEDTDLTKYITLDDHNSLRVLTHMLLIFMGLGLDLGGVYRETEVQNVIVAYISFLKLAAKEELIPLYCSQLSGTRRYSILSRNLIDITDEEQQILQLKLIRELGLDAQEFVSLQARHLLDDFPDVTTEYPAIGNFKLFLDAPDTMSIYRTLKKEFIVNESPVERIDLLLIRSLQWYLLVDGLWVEAFRFGTLLYLRFFKHMNLYAAKLLSINVHSKTIMDRKTKAIFGESINLYNPSYIEDDSSTSAVKAHMLAEASNFRELEILIECLDNIDTASCLADVKKQGLSSQNPPVLLREWRNDYHTACREVCSLTGLLMKDWLVKTPNESIQDELRLVREAYLPETLLAYVTTLHTAGLLSSRDYLLEIMEMSSLLAGEGSDTLEVFVKTGRLAEMVDNIARASKTILNLSSMKQTIASRGTRLKKRGWSLDLWNVKV